MPVPKKRMSQTRTSKRRSHHAIKNIEASLNGVSHRLKKFYDRQDSLIKPEVKK